MTRKSALREDFSQIPTLGDRDFSGLGLRPKMCRPSANTENFRRAREKPLVPRVTDTMNYVTRFLGPTVVIRPWFELTASSPLAGHQHVFKWAINQVALNNIK